MSTRITAKKFVAENDKSPVVYGAVFPEPPRDPEGVTYTLDNRKTFTLSRAESVKLPKGYPKWKGIS